MTQRPENPDEFEKAIRRLEKEIENRQPDYQPPPDRPDPPEYGEAEPTRMPGYSLPLPLSTPRAVYVLLVINIIIYILTGLLSFLLSGNLQFLFQPAGPVLQLGWKQNDLILSGEYWRFLTAMFLHGNLMHILFNGFALYALGPETERVFGTPRFLLIYFLSGFAGGVASYAMSPSPSVGASGAIFGLIGALAVFFYLARDILGDMGRQQLQSMIFIIVINLFIGFSFSGVIDNWAHIGGLVGGALAGFVLAPRFAIDQRLYPPTVVRSFNPQGWALAAALFVLLVVMAFVINPPLLSPL